VIKGRKRGAVGKSRTHPLYATTKKEEMEVIHLALKEVSRGEKRLGRRAYGFPEGKKRTERTLRRLKEKRKRTPEEKRRIDLAHQNGPLPRKRRIEKGLFQSLFLKKKKGGFQKRRNPASLPLSPPVMTMERGEKEKGRGRGVVVLVSSSQKKKKRRRPP